MRIIDGGFASGLFYCCENVFGADVADQIVSGERAAAQSSERAIEAAATGLVRRVNFCFGVFAAAVQMRAEFDTGYVFLGALKNGGDNFWSGVACGVGQGNGFDASIFPPLESFLY